MPRKEKRRHRRALWIGLVPGYYHGTGLTGIGKANFWRCACGEIAVWTSQRMPFKAARAVLRRKARRDNISLDYCRCKRGSLYA